MTETATLDSFDLSLLKLVQVNNLMPARMLAEKVGLSESAVLRRLRQMRANGTIAADVDMVVDEVGDRGGKEREHDEIACVDHDYRCERHD